MNTIQFFLLRTPRSLKDYTNVCVDPSIRMSQTDSYWNVSRGLVTALWLGRWTLSLNIGWHIFLFFRSTFSSTLRSTAYPSCPHVACVLLVTFLSLFFSFCFVFPLSGSWCNSRRPSWLPVTEATWRQAWPFPPPRSTRWGHSISTVCRPLPWPRCRVSFIRHWVSNSASLLLLRDGVVLTALC